MQLKHTQRQRLAVESRVGMAFGKYNLVSLLGKGGMGEVYEAYDTDKNRTVGLKILATRSPTMPRFGSGSSVSPKRRPLCKNHTSYPFTIGVRPTAGYISTCASCTGTRSTS